jgi:hypothetical protein
MSGIYYIAKTAHQHGLKHYNEGDNKNPESIVDKHWDYIEQLLIETQARIDITKTREVYKSSMMNGITNNKNNKLFITLTNNNDITLYTYKPKLKNIKAYTSSLIEMTHNESLKSLMFFQDNRCKIKTDNIMSFGNSCLKLANEFIRVNK